jgi:NADH:ubiquinone oxidoreductase subunit
LVHGSSPRLATPSYRVVAAPHSKTQRRTLWQKNKCAGVMAVYEPNTSLTNSGEPQLWRGEAWRESNKPANRQFLDVLGRLRTGNSEPGEAVCVYPASARHMPNRTQTPTSQRAKHVCRVPGRRPAGTLTLASKSKPHTTSQISDYSTPPQAGGADADGAGM